MSKRETVTQLGREPVDSETAVVERIRSVLEDIEPELAGYLLNGDKPAQVLDAVLGDVEEMATMFGCTMIGSPEHYGGQPAEKVLSEWTYLVERKVRLAKTLTEKVREGGSDV